MKINWFGSFDDNVNFFYPIFILYIGFVGSFVSVRSAHGEFSKTKLIGLLPIRGVDPLGWFFEQPLLNGAFAGDGFFLPTNFHGRMMKMVEFSRWRRLLLPMFSFFRVSTYCNLNFLFTDLLYVFTFSI